MVLLSNILWWLSLTDLCPNKRFIWKDVTIDGPDARCRKTTKDVGWSTCSDPCLTSKFWQHVLRDVGVGVHEVKVIVQRLQMTFEGPKDTNI